MKQAVVEQHAAAPAPDPLSSRSAQQQPAANGWHSADANGHGSAGGYEPEPVSERLDRRVTVELTALKGGRDDQQVALSLSVQPDDVPPSTQHPSRGADEPGDGRSARPTQPALPNGPAANGLAQLMNGAATSRPASPAQRLAAASAGGDRQTAAAMLHEKVPRAISAMLIVGGAAVHGSQTAPQPLYELCIDR